METLNSRCWSELPSDILISVFERIGFVDFHRAKIVCRNWYMCSKQTVPRKTGSPWLILFPEDDKNFYLYNPDEARVYKTKRDLSGFRFLANSGNWFLLVDSKSNLYIIDVFSEKSINLPPLESINGDHYNLERIGDKEFMESVIGYSCFNEKQSQENLRGVLWVDEKKEEYVVVWYFSFTKYIAFCKNEEDRYRYIRIHWEFRTIECIILRGESLYVSTSNDWPKILDLSKESFKEVYFNDSLLKKMRPPHPLSGTTYVTATWYKHIAVTTSGDVLYIQSIHYVTSHMNFRIYKRGPNPNSDEIVNNRNPIVEIDSLGDEALLLDLGITVHADFTLGIEPNSIYYISCYNYNSSLPDICVFNLATKTLKRFPVLSDLKLTDARWFVLS